MIRCFLLLPVIAACAPGCSFIYDPADLTSADDGPVAIDASVDGNDASVVDSFPLPDVDPGILDIFKVSPPALFEAAGSVRPVPVVLRGQNLGPDATFTITGADGIEVVDGWQASGDGHYAAFSVKVPVVTGCDSGDMPLTITVTDGDEMTTAELMLTCLPELSLSGSYSTDDSPAGPLLFSTIDVTGDVVVTGANPLRLVATGPITVAGIIHADGSGQSAGPGGCAGAPKNADGGCGAGGGRNGAGNAGGGGGGHGTAAAGGGDASNGSGGMPGTPTGSDFLAPFVSGDDEGSRGNGGGGGGGNGGGNGGGGGGVVALSTAGQLTITAAGGISAAGGDGKDGAGTLGLTCNGGGGGGGSGGAILVRAAAALMAEAGASITVDPGNAGNAKTSACGGGGDGGYGRVRLDSPAATADGAVSTAITPVHGPMWIDLPSLTGSATLSATISGDSARVFGLSINGGAATAVSAGAPVEVPLTAGYNTLCLLVEQAASLQQSEAKNCLTVAYIAP